MDLIPERICKDILDKYDNYNIEKKSDNGS